MFQHKKEIIATKSIYSNLIPKESIGALLVSFSDVFHFQNNTWCKIIFDRQDQDDFIWLEVYRMINLCFLEYPFGDLAFSVHADGINFKNLVSTNELQTGGQKTKIL